MTRVDIVGVHETLAKENGELGQPDGIDKSTLLIATPRHYRNREPLRYVAQQVCLVCGRKQSDPHHLRYLQPRALGRKVSDEFAVPLCRSHHRAVHRASDEQAWWKATGIDPVEAACHLWRQTRLKDPRDPHQPGPAICPKTRSIASASDDMKELVRFGCHGARGRHSILSSRFSSAASLPPIRRPNHASRFEGIPKTKLQASGASEPIHEVVESDESVVILLSA
jgi:hypothetical protein